MERREKFSSRKRLLKLKMPMTQSEGWRGRAWNPGLKTSNVPLSLETAVQPESGSSSIRSWCRWRR